MSNENAGNPKSGTSRSYEERQAKGQPNITLSMATADDKAIDTLAARLGVTRSQAVARAVREMLASESSKAALTKGVT